jgi:hypothetical protein
MGDGIISFFGAPLELPDHALKACTAAVIMKRLEVEVNKHLTKKGIDPLFTRIGINTDNMVVGNMGTSKKMNYTISGNAVNLASRLEGVNKQYGTWIIASENTIAETNEMLLSRQLDRIRVLGLNEPVRIHEVLDIKADASPELQENINNFSMAHTLFESRNWKDAETAFSKIFERVPGDSLSGLYLDRCRQYIKEPPPKDWDGVYNMVSDISGVLKETRTSYWNVT